MQVERMRDAPINCRKSYAAQWHSSCGHVEACACSCHEDASSWSSQSFSTRIATETKLLDACRWCRCCASARWPATLSSRRRTRCESLIFPRLDFGHRMHLQHRWRFQVGVLLRPSGAVHQFLLLECGGLVHLSCQPVKLQRCHDDALLQETHRCMAARLTVEISVCRRHSRARYAARRAV